jgi:hypothetical protein
MRISFVGGPKDGKSEEAVDPPERMWVNNAEGGRCLYAVRRFTGTANPAQKKDGYHKIYAPTDMTAEQFAALSLGLV